MEHSFENKRAKFHQKPGTIGHLELRSLKSERNYEKSKSKALKKARNIKHEF